VAGGTVPKEEGAIFTNRRCQMKKQITAAQQSKMNMIQEFLANKNNVLLLSDHGYANDLTPVYDCKCVHLNVRRSGITLTGTAVDGADYRDVIQYNEVSALYRIAMQDEDFRNFVAYRRAAEAEFRACRKIVAPEAGTDYIGNGGASYGTRRPDVETLSQAQLDVTYEDRYSSGDLTAAEMAAA
jgi:hypothetical protein